MKRVRIIADYDASGLMHQTPRSSGVWDGIQFTLEPVSHCDYAIVLNHVPRKTRLRCPKQNIWVIVQEPPIKNFKWMSEEYLGKFSKVYVPDVTLSGSRYVHSHGAIGWHIGKDYDFLKNCPVPEKNRGLSWVTSNKVFVEGHRQRMLFLDRIRYVVPFDLWGSNLNPLKVKWDGVAPYRYSLAIENYSGPHYWSEKIADCFLAYTMPVYYGCTNIGEYFPEESFVRIDIRDPAEAIDIIKETVASDLWVRNRDAIVHARELVLERYQLFPFMNRQIREHENRTVSASLEIEGAQCLLVPPPLPLRRRALDSFMWAGRFILPASVRDWLWIRIGRYIYP